MSRINDDTRGQATNPWPTPLVLVLVVSGLLVFVGKTVLSEVGSVDTALMETTCLGVWGCGTPSPLAVTATVAMLIVLIGTIAFGLRGGLPR